MPKPLERRPLTKEQFRLEIETALDIIQQAMAPLGAEEENQTIIEDVDNQIKEIRELLALRDLIF